MNDASILIVTSAVIIVGFILDVVRRDDDIPYMEICFLAVYLPLTVYWMLRGAFVYSAIDATFCALSAKEIWDWWNRKGKKRAAKLLSRISIHQGKLIVVPISSK